MEFSPIITEQLKHSHFLNIDPKKLEYRKNSIFQSTPVVKLDKKFKCNCSKSKCLKGYCICFQNHEVCDENCECCECSNITQNKGKQIAVELGFCRCAESQCQKLYCECFKNGRDCNNQCRCVSCKNKLYDYGIQQISVLIDHKKIIVEERDIPLLSKKRTNDVDLRSTREQTNKKVRKTNGLDSHADIKKKLKW
jgi:hypothetical protein